MINNPGKTFSREDIGKLIDLDKERSIDVIITRLRKKIETDPKNPKLALTKVKYQNPILEDVFKELSDLHFPDFVYDSVQLTKNFQIQRHIDSKNVGESVLIALGDYKGGETCIEYEGDILEVDCRNGPIRFNGSECYHWVKPFIGGDRYSVVFFNLYKK